jgi:amino acid permease
MSSSNGLTLVALLNAMIGSSILVLPLLMLKTGVITTAVLVLVSGVFSWYSCELTMQHIHPHENTFS